MNEIQQEAVKVLEQAMIKVEAAGLLLTNLDGELIAYPAYQVVEITLSPGNTGDGWPQEATLNLDYAKIECPYVGAKDINDSPSQGGSSDLQTGNRVELR